MQPEWKVLMADYVANEADGVSPAEAAWLQKLESKEWNSEELNNLYTNALKKGFNSLADRIHERLRTDFPAVARKRFGAKDEQARELLAKVYEELAEHFDLSRNKVGNGVKTGGFQISGEKHVNVYISYRNSAGRGIALGLFQDSPDTAMKVELVDYKVGRDKHRDELFVPMNEFQNMAQKYQECLQQISDNSAN